MPAHKKARLGELALSIAFAQPLLQEVVYRASSDGTSRPLLRLLYVSVGLTKGKMVAGRAIWQRGTE